MKIAIVNQPLGTVVLPWTGKGSSMDIWTYEVARRLAQSCLVVVYTRRDHYQKKAEYDQGVHYRRIPTTFDMWYPYMYYALERAERKTGCRDLRRAIFLHNVRRPLFASNLYYSTYALQVARDLRKEKCDIVHVINFFQFASVIRALNPKTKIVLGMHCEWLTQLDRAIIERRLRDINLVIGNSEYITEKVRRCFPQFAEHCRTVCPGINVDEFVGCNDGSVLKQNGIKRLLFVGRVSPEKGLHVLLAALKKVVKRYPKAHLEIIGPQWQLPLEFLVTLSDDANLASFHAGNSTLSFFNHLQRQVLSLDIAENVTFTGFIPHLQLVNHYRNADLLVNPSLSESFGRSLIEAMACGVPVIATRVGGMTEIVEEGKTGLLVEPGDAQALAEAILRLLSDEDLRKTMGKAARRRAVELFSWEKTVEHLLRQYMSTCECHD